MPIDAGMKLIVALLYTPGRSGKKNEKIRGITRLDKLLFLSQKEAIRKELYEFEAYDYGPWSGNIQGDVEALEEGGLVKIDLEEVRIYAEIADWKEDSNEVDAEESDIAQLEIYSLTDAGLKAGKKIYEEQLTPKERENLVSIKEKYNSTSLTDLLKYVYANYPLMTGKSKILDKLMKKELYGKRPSLLPYMEDES